MYDSIEALRVIVERTGESDETVQKFLTARFRYQELNYLTEPDEDPIAERELHVDLITNSRNGPFMNEDPGMVLRYVLRVTGMSEGVIANMIAEETAYMVQKGIVAPECYQDEREWADAIQSALKQQSDALGDWSM